MKKACFLLTIFIILAGVSCAGSDSDTPVIPSPIGSVSPGSQNASHMLWGLWRIAIDTTTTDVEIVPMRDGMFHANVVQYLQPPFPLGINVFIEGMDLVTGDFDIIVSLAHPFDDPTLTGFDVKGIFITNGIFSSTHDPTLIYSDYILSPSLTNADGMTRWWNQQEFTSSGLLGYTEGVLGTRWVTFANTLNPFKYFSENLGKDDEFTVEPGERNHFLYGTSNARRYYINFPIIGGNPLVFFNYAVDACWESPVGDPSDLANFPPEANQSEPYRITVDDLGSNAYFDPVSETGGGSLHLGVSVSDYGWRFNPSNGVADELIGVVLDSPTIQMTNSVVLTETDVTSFNGETVYYDVFIPDVAPTGFDHQYVLVHAICAEGTYDQGYGTPAPDKPLAAYFLWEANVINGLPIPDAPVVTDVDIDRDSNGKLTGFTLDWDDTTLASEYHVYWSTDPYESAGPMVFNPAPGGIVTESNYSYSITPSSAEQNGQWMLYIVARGLSGNPLSDSEPSVNVLIDFAGFENFYEGQNEWRRRHNSIRNRFIAYTLPFYGINSSGALILSPNYQFIRNATAYCVSPELPEIVGASHSYLEFAHNRTVDIPDDYGYSICTLDYLQDPTVIDQDLKDEVGGTPDYMVVWDYHVDVVDSVGYISGDQMNDSDIQGLGYSFNESPEENGEPINGWSGTAGSGFVVSRYEAPKVIDENHTYVGVCFAGEGDILEPPFYPIIPPQYPLICDEIALVVF